MRKQLLKPRNGIMFLALASVFMVAVLSHSSRVEAKCDLPGEKHGDWNPSSHEFFKKVYSASLCEVAICIDKGECTNHDSVNWKKFQQSPAWVDATDKQKDEMKEYHEDGNGMKGFGGYELLEVVQETN